GVGTEIGRAFLFLGQIGNELDEVLDTAISDPDRARRERGIAAALRDRRTLENGHARAFFARRERRAQRGIPAADHDHVLLSHAASVCFSSSFCRFGIILDRRRGALHSAASAGSLSPWERGTG